MDDGYSVPYFRSKFFRKDKDSSPGNGLGLPMVKRILQLNQGSVTVESTPGSGSSFVVTLPVQK